MFINRTCCFLIFVNSIIINISVKGQEQKSFIQTPTGVEVAIKSAIQGVKKIRLEPVTANIIHVTTVPGIGFPKDTSLIAVKRNNTGTKFTVAQQGDVVVLTTDSLKAEVSSQTGLIAFLDLHGNKLLSQSDKAYEAFVSKVYDGAPTYEIKQIFTSQENEGYYGLGQHQQGLINYKGRRIDLAQYNTDIAVPLVVSNKGYGLLWDNYSITSAGNITPYEPLSALRLFSRDNEEGWLTCNYVKKGEPEKVLLTQPVSDISFSWLTDLHKFPKGLKVEDTEVFYEGSLASDLPGLFQLHMKYSGYFKIWIDDKLVGDFWRQAWNSGSALLDLNLQKDKRIKIKMHWIPAGAESYLSLKCLPPISETLKNTFAFSSESGQAINYYFIKGSNADKVISGYREITGKAVLMPQWAMGLWQSRERYKTQQEILTTAKEFRDRKIPLDNIVMDWSYWKEAEWGSQEFDLERFPSPDSMIHQLHAEHIQFMISVWPKFYMGHPAYEAFSKNNFFYKRNIADGRRDWIGTGYQSTFYDAYNPSARKAFWDLMNKKLYSKGVDAWWLDATEPDLHSNLPVQNRKEMTNPTYFGSSTTYFNAFPLLNAQGVYEGQRQANPKKRVFILTRSAFAGMQRCAAASWSGDIASRWEDMKTQISAGVNFSMSGLPYWAMDIGGFSVETRYEKPDAVNLEEWRELNTRWYQFGAFVPLFRVHGQFPFREIFNIAPPTHEAYLSMLYYIKLRYRLMPYIYSLAGKSFHDNYTIMRGLVMDFPQDTKAINLNDEYMFGPSLLINPVYAYKARTKEVYLPEGQGWYDLYSGKYFKGGQSVVAPAPYSRMPLFVKEGSIIPAGPEIQYTSEKPSDPTTLFVYSGSDGSFSLYEDEGINYNYENGSFTTINFTYNHAKKTLTISDRKGNFPGMLENRNFHVVVITPTSGTGMDFNLKPKKAVKYSGKQTIVSL